MESNQITPERAISMLPDKEVLQVIREFKENMMAKASYKKDEVISLIRKCGAELAGEEATKKSFGLCLMNEGKLIFVETKAV